MELPKITFVTNVKSVPSCSYYLKKAEMKIATFAHFKEYRGNHKHFRSLYDLGGRCLKIRDVGMDFKLFFKVHRLVSVHPKSIILGQTDQSLHVVLSVYRFLEFETRPSSQLNFGTANSALIKGGPHTSQRFANSSAVISLFDFKG